MKHCRKCGMSLEYNKHDEEICDYVFTDDISVEDLEVEPRWTLSNGYGLWELCIIHDIMRKLWIDSSNKRYNNWMTNSKLFDEAEKIYNNG